MEGHIIRPAQPEDLPELTDLYNHYVRTSPATFDLVPATLEARRQWMSHYADEGPHRLFVAESGGSVAGYATSGKFRDKPGYLTSIEATIYVRPDRHGQGVGTRLYAALFASLEQEDVHRAYAGIVLPNEASMALHLRFGFRPAGLYREVGRKFGKYWDVQWLERPFPDHDSG